MDMLNNVILMGRLVRDPETNYLQSSNSSVTRFTLAVEKSYKSGDEWQTKASFINCVAWNKTGEFIGKHFRQGNMICVNGSIETGSYTNRDGQKVYTTDIIVDKAYFTGENKAAAEESENNDYNYGRPAPSNSDGFMNIPDGIDEELPFN